MSSKDYPKVPSAVEQIKTTTIILALCVLGFYFLNFDLGFSTHTKRLLTRIGGWVVLAGGLLGGFGFLWNKKNKIKLTMAQKDFNAHSIAIASLKTQNTDGAVQESINTLQSEIDEATKAISAATSFEDDVARVGIFALILLTMGTFMQVISA